MFIFCLCYIVCIVKVIAIHTKNKGKLGMQDECIFCGLLKTNNCFHVKMFTTQVFCPNTGKINVEGGKC